jgi:hypothetical protein
MHVVAGVLSTVAGLIRAMVALQRSGFDPASLNPSTEKYFEKLHAKKSAWATG